MTHRTGEPAPTWPDEIDNAADSGAMTQIFELPGKLDASLLPAEPSLDEAYHRFVTAADACHVVHSDFDAVFATLRELQTTQTEQSTTTALGRLTDAWRRLDAAILRLTAVVPRGHEVMASVTADLHQLLRGLLTRCARLRSGPSGQCRVELDALADRLAQYDGAEATAAGERR